MSLINKMLQDLDRRHAMAGADQAVPPRQVRAVEHAHPGREWFWRSVAALMLAAVGWVGWIVYQVQARPLATELAFRAAEEARSRKPVIAPAPAPAPAFVPASAPATVAPAPPAEPAQAGVPFETLKIAQSIETPITEPVPRAAANAKSAAESLKTKPVAVPVVAVPARADPTEGRKAPASLSLDVPPARVLPAPVSAGRVEKRDRVRTPAERAEAEYRRAVTLLNQGRASEAEEGLFAALAQEPAHEAARQALVALLFEQRNLDAARRILQDGLAINPAQPTFAMGLARIFVERRELPAALGALDGAAGAAAGNGEFHALRGTVLQRLARHREAAEAYQHALRIQPANPQAWIGLGISLEALAQKPEAAEAFRRSLAAGPASAELRSFAEQRVRALQ